MITRPAPNRAEFAVLVLAWVSFAAVAAFAPLWATVVSALASCGITIAVVFGVIEPRVRREETVDSYHQTLGRALGLKVPLRDAVERAAESVVALGARTQELRRVIDGLDDPVMATDRAGVIVLANAAADAFVGLGAGAAVGRTVEELLPQTGVIALHAGAAGGRAGHDQVSIHRAGGRRIFQVFAAPLGEAPEGERLGVVITLRDVTELAAAVRLQTDFVANASHELRTPLSSIRAAAETLEAAHDDPPMVERLTEMIRANCARLEELVADMLDLSRLQSDEAPLVVATVDLAALFDDLRELFAGVHRERGLTLVFECGPGLETMQTEEKALKLILRNLLENSSKFAYEGTSITVRVGRPSPGMVRFEVMDRGEGIPIGAQARVFERFFQADAARTGSSPRRGTGLGLAMVKQAVTRLGGAVSVESVWKEGTTMTVDLPG